MTKPPRKEGKIFMLKAIKKTAIIVIVVTMLFGTMVIATACDNNPNQGRIRGFEGGEFTAYFGHGILPPYGFGQYEILLINNQSELSAITEQEFFASYDDLFFASHQLVMIGYWGGYTEDQIRRVSYLNNILSIELIPIRRCALAAAHMRSLVVEITRISDNLNVEITRRGR